jgi:hypothetical protein
LLNVHPVSTVKKVARPPRHAPPAEAHILALNVATLGLVDEIVRLPGMPVARTAIQLLWGPTAAVPDEFLGHAGTGMQIPYTSLLASPAPLAALLPARLGPAGVWREGPNALKSIRGLARTRYRELQAAFVSGAPRAVPEAAEALVRYTYGTHGRHWIWADSARRLIERVVTLNRAALALLAALSRGVGTVDVPGLSFEERSFDVPDHTLDLLAEALPPVAIPEWARLTRALVRVESPLGDEESLERFRSLFAEMLGMSSQPEVHR